MSQVPPEELAERQALGARYHAHRRIDQIDAVVRGISIAIKILKQERLALLTEKDSLRDSLREVEGLGK